MRRDRCKFGRLAVACAVTVIGLAAAQAVVANQAQAVSGLVRVAKTTVSDSSTSKTVAAECPAGQRVIGGGGAVIGGRGQVVLERLQPTRTATDDRFVAGAREDETGYGRDWRLRAFALCSDPLPGQVIATGVSGPLSDRLQTTLAICPPRTHQVGFGGRIERGAGQVYTTDLFPSFVAPPTGTFMRAREDTNGFAGAWSMTAYTVCASSAAGFTNVVSAAPASSRNKSATVSCPTGTQVHSAGFQLGGAGTSPIDGVHADRVTIDSRLGSITVRGVEDEDRTNANWSVRASALCAP
jgi:hypothetical protein